jgi:hypothetical protein
VWAWIVWLADWKNSLEVAQKVDWKWLEKLTGSGWKN